VQDIEVAQGGDRSWGVISQPVAGTFKNRIGGIESGRDRNQSKEHRFLRDDL
jgi:hypothetical protein